MSECPSGILEVEEAGQVKGGISVEDTVQMFCVLCVSWEEIFGRSFHTDTAAVVQVLVRCDIFSPWVHVLWGGEAMGLDPVKQLDSFLSQFFD